jgi:hypothetical protein
MSLYKLAEEERVISVSSLTSLQKEENTEYCSEIMRNVSFISYSII